jgi:hypothetical protein
MANIITAGNSTNGGTAISTDTSGTLDIKTGSGSGTTAISVDASQTTTFAAGVSGTTGSFSGNMSFNSGYGSAAVAYGCRAWVNFIGASATIRASGNVTSITRNSAGVYTVSFTTAMPDANYSAVAAQATDGYAVRIDTYNTANVRVVTFSGTNTTDSSTTSVAVFR